MPRALLLILCLLSPAPSWSAEGPLRRREAIELQIKDLRARLHSEAEALEKDRESGWWDLVSRRRKENRLRRLRMLQLRLERLERELAAFRDTI